MDKYFINVSINGSHFCRIELSTCENQFEKAKAQLFTLRELFGPTYKLTLASSTTSGVYYKGL